MRSISARSISALLSVVLVAACAPADEVPEVEDTTPAVEAETEPAGAMSLADFAGTWQNEATLEGVEEPIRSTMTGSASSLDSAAVTTFRCRQSSLMGLAAPMLLLPWGQRSGHSVASRTPSQGATGCGGCQRRLPTGAAA